MLAIAWPHPARHATTSSRPPPWLAWRAVRPACACRVRLWRSRRSLCRSDRCSRTGAHRRGPRGVGARRLAAAMSTPRSSMHVAEPESGPSRASRGKHRSRRHGAAPARSAEPDCSPERARHHAPRRKPREEQLAISDEMLGSPGRSARRSANATLTNVVRPHSQSLGSWTRCGTPRTRSGPSPPASSSRNDSGRRPQTLRSSLSCAARSTTPWSGIAEEARFAPAYGVIGELTVGLHQHLMTLAVETRNSAPS